MTVNDYKQILLLRKNNYTQEQFLYALSHNSSKKQKSLYNLFRRAFSLNVTEETQLYPPTEDQKTEPQQNNNNDILSPRKLNSTIETQLSDNLNHIRQSIEDNIFAETRFPKSLPAFEKSENMDEEQDSTLKLAAEFYNFLKMSVVYNKKPAKNDIKLWTFFRGGMELLSGYAIRKELERLVDEDYIPDRAESNSIWWYAVKLWRDKQPDDISSILAAIKMLLRVEIPPNGITAIYYTALSSLNFIFPDKEADSNDNRFHPSIMSVSTMNDPEEGHILQEYLDEENKHSHRYWWNLAPADGGEKMRYHSIEPYVFCKSFTNVDRLDDLSMWEVYGDRAEGACCKIRVRRGNGKKNAEYLYNIAYLNHTEMRVVQLGGERRQQSNEYKFELLDNLLLILKAMVNNSKKTAKALGDEGKARTAANWRNWIMGIAYLFKYDSYSHENEMRYLFSLIGSDTEELRRLVSPVGGSPSEKTLPILSVSAEVAFEYQEVILGPKVKNPDNAAAYLVHKFRIATGSDTLPRITKSTIHYR